MLTGLQAQQQDKVSTLQSRLEADAQLRREQVEAAADGTPMVPVRVRSVRFRQDVRAGVSRWVAARKERERNRAAAHRAEIGNEIAAGRQQAATEEHTAAMVLTVSIEPVTAPMGRALEANFTNMAGKSVLVTHFNPGATFASSRNSHPAWLWRMALEGFYKIKLLPHVRLVLNYLKGIPGFREN